MKKLIFLALLLALTIQLPAQTGEFWGITEQGGTDGVGSVYKTDSNGNNPTTVHSFTLDYPGKDPENLTLVELNGLLYGTTIDGGLNEEGTLFSYDPVNDVFTNLIEFDNGITGGSPQGKFTIANGKLYGIASSNGPNGSWGTIYEYDPNTAAIQVIHDFDGMPAAGIEAEITLGSDGNLYGVGRSIGTNFESVIYKYDFASSNFSVLYQLDDINLADGKMTNPAQLLEITPGKLLGTTERGGSFDDGVLFEFDYTTNTYTKILDFQQGVNGANPEAGLILASNQMAYGTTSVGGTNNQGTIYEYDPINQTITTIYSFDSSTGSIPLGELTEVGNGVLYGLTVRGGTNNDGFLYQFDLSTNNYTAIEEFFRFDEGDDANGALLLASNGKLYGATSDGGPALGGAIFEYTPGASSISIVIPFLQAFNGKVPLNRLTYSQNGKIYGSANDGGTNRGGLLFEIDPTNGNYAVVHDFINVTEGRGPNSELIEIGNILYGVTSGGGTNSSGTIFSFDYSNNTYTVLHDFDAPTGNGPSNSLTLGSNGKLYGGVNNGGANGFGGLFEFDLTTNTYSLLFSFDFNIDGYLVDGKLVETAPGIFYGTNLSGGPNFSGTAYKFDANTNTFTVIKNFGTNVDGFTCLGGLLSASDGLLYGTTQSGGTNFGGTIFTIDPTTDTYSVAFNLGSQPDPANPTGVLIQGTNGKIYGSTSSGGNLGIGTLFEYDPIGNTIQTKVDGPLYNVPRRGVIFAPDNIAPVAGCQDLNIVLDMDEAGTYVPLDLDNGSSDNSGNYFLGLPSFNRTIATIGLSPIDDYFDDGNQYFFTQGALIVPATGNVSFVDPAINAGNANSILAIYEAPVIPNSGLIDNRPSLVGYVTFTGNTINGNNVFFLEDTKTYFFQRGSFTPLATGNFDLTSDVEVVYSGIEKTVDCIDVGTINETLYVYDVAGNRSTCASTITVSENELPVASASLDLVMGSENPCTSADFEVDAVVSDNCPNPVATRVIKIPDLVNPVVLFKVKPVNGLKIRLADNAVKVFGPNPQAFWAQVQADGGIAVNPNQIIKFRELPSNAFPLVYGFNGSNELSTVKAETMTLEVTGTDASGNTASSSADAVIPCPLVNDPLQESTLLENPTEVPEINTMLVSPNPFIDRLNIKLDLVEPQAITLNIFDLNGKLIAQIFQGQLSAGQHQFNWNISDSPNGHLAPGLYLVQSKSAKGIQNQKVTLVR